MCQLKLQTKRKDGMQHFQFRDLLIVKLNVTPSHLRSGPMRKTPVFYSVGRRFVTSGFAEVSQVPS